MATTRQHTATTALSLAALVLLWALSAWWIDMPRTFPGPLKVGGIILTDAASGKLWDHMWHTLLRVAAAFSIAMGIGVIIGLALGLWPRLNRWADPWVIVALNIPALVVIVMCYLWIGLNEVAAIVAVSFNKTAMVVVTVREGARALDRQIAQMAQVYRLPLRDRLRHVVIPQLAPFLSTAARNGLAIIWKLVLVVEFLGRPNGIGFQIHLNFQLFDVPHVLAYALSFIMVMLLIEYLVMQRIERHAMRWRGVVGHEGQTVVA